MRASLEFLFGLLEQDESAFVSQDDWNGPHAAIFRVWQRLGFIRPEAFWNPVVSCPFCWEGVPYRFRGRHVCSRCRSTVDPRHFQLWPLDLQALLQWVAVQWHLVGWVRQVDTSLWQLGTLEWEERTWECFFLSQELILAAGRKRLDAYRSALLIYGLTPPALPGDVHWSCLSLVELLHVDDGLSVRDPLEFLESQAVVRFDPHSGALWAGGKLQGEVPVGSREYYFLAYLASHLDYFVPYSDLKHVVLQQSGGTDETEEATFCQGLKSRIKKKWIPAIDQLIVTTNKADGYRLRGWIKQ